MKDLSSLRGRGVTTWEDCQHVLARYSFASAFVKGKLVLDLGCGTGYGSQFLLNAGAETVVGGDITPEVLDTARSEYKDNRLRFMELDATHLPFADHSIDVVASFEMIEHLHNYNEFLAECVRVLKPQGVFVCSTPNKDIYSFGFDKSVFPYHVKEFTVSELRTLLEEYFHSVTLYGLDKQSRRRTFLRKLKYRIIQMTRPIPGTTWVLDQLNRGLNLILGLVSPRFRSARPVNVLESFSGSLEPQFEPFPLEAGVNQRNLYTIAVCQAVANKHFPMR